MTTCKRRTRPLRIARHRAGLLSGLESLESRRLLAATPINVASGVLLATGLPVPGLATGVGVGATAQTMPASTIGVTASPTTAGSPFGSSATGPSTTLSPLSDDSETALAPASEVARATPGRSDRISVLIESPEIVLIPHLGPAANDAFIPGPEVRALPPAPVPAPAAPAAPARVEPAPNDAPKAAPEAMAPISFEIWDATLELVSAEITEGSTTPIDGSRGSALAAGALLAAWGGWKYGPSLEGRSRRRPGPVCPEVAGPDGGPGV